MNIKKVSELTGMSADTIRYYEKIGILPHIKRNRAGVREFSEHDIEIIHFVLYFKKAGFSVDALIEYVNLLQAGDHTVEERLALLIDQRRALQKRIDDLYEAMEHLNYKIGHYEKTILPREYELFKREKNRED